jgi:hypothetical protein
MTESRRVQLFIPAPLDDELHTLADVVGVRQWSRLVIHLLDRAIEPYRPAILAAQRARQIAESQGVPCGPASPSPSP